MRSVLVVSVLLALPCVLTSAQPLAFPGAEGWGRFSTGGRGGDVYIVTNLDDDGPGSLRDALREGNRTVVFEVSGTIRLESDLHLTQSNITVAGQTAPGDGICLRRSALLVAEAHDIIIRYLRVRPGDERGKALDGIEVREAENVVIDHCSVSWTMDEATNTYHGTKNLTIQWCLFSEPLDDSTNYAPHGYGASWGGEHVTYHHNLFAHAAGRNPSVAGGDGPRAILMDHRNSVIYNWQHRTCDGKPESINVVNNYYKPGPATRDGVRHRLVRVDDTMAKYGFESVWHIAGNVIEGAPDISADNALGVEFVGNTNAAKNTAPDPFPTAPVITQSAEEAYRLVLAHAGADRPRRDALDTRVLREVATGTAQFGDQGIIDSQDEVGGWPLLASEPAPRDADRDGMADAWEEAKGLDPASPGDRNATTLHPPYTNLEVYLHSLTGLPGME